MSELNEDGNPICPTHQTELYSDGSCSVDDCQFIDEEINSQFLEDTDDMEYDEDDEDYDPDFVAPEEEELD